MEFEVPHVLPGVLPRAELQALYRVQDGAGTAADLPSGIKQSPSKESTKIRL